MPAISVIIPTFNHGGLVLQTLESVFAQTFSDYEVIVVNDGSPDNTAQVLTPLVEAGRINYIEQPNAGQAAARNRGLAASRGEYIAFLDDDDLWPADKLSWQVEVLERDPQIGGVGGGLELIDKEGRPLRAVPQFEGAVTTARLFKGNPFWSPGQTLIRAKIVRAFGGLNQSLWGTDDWDLWFRVAKYSPMLSVSRRALFYRAHPGNAGKNMLRMFDNSVEVIEERLRDVPGNVQRQLSRDGYRYLFDYAGTTLLRRFRSDLVRLRLRSSAQTAKRLSRLARPALADRGLLKSICRELVRR